MEISLMKKLTTAIIVSALMASAVLPVSADNVRTCTSVYGGGEVCGETSTTVSTNVTHTTVDAGFSRDELNGMAIAMAISGLVAMLAYRATYRWYNK